MVSTMDHELTSIDPQDEPQVETKEGSKEYIKLQSKEASAPQVDYVLFSSNIHLMLLPRQVEDQQNEAYILEFETFTANLRSNFFKHGEYDS